MKKVLIVFGTRPEAIKMAPLVHAFSRYKSEFNTKVCVTAQHREMLDQVLSMFQIESDYDLNLMKPNQDLFDITVNVLVGMKSVLEDFQPDLVLVHGDTTTTLATSLAAFYLGIHIGHIEAGLRTNDLYSPWPEEMNRQLTDRISTYFFVPTTASKENLIRENTNSSNIVVTGNTVIDALFFTLNKFKRDDCLLARIRSKIEKRGFSLNENRRLILVTGHRRENFGKEFLEICRGLKQISIAHPEVDILYPVHPNPNVRKPVKKILSNISNVFLLEPIEYESFVYLMSKSYLIITDSGGIQEEAPSLGKPVLVMRNTTERPEAVSAGTVKLVGTNRTEIVNCTNELLNNKNLYEKMSEAINPYGDGKACDRIINYLKEN